MASDQLCWHAAGRASEQTALHGTNETAAHVTSIEQNMLIKVNKVLSTSICFYSVVGSLR